MRWLKRFPVPFRDKADTSYRDDLEGARLLLRQNLVWTDEILPMIDRKIDDLEGEILEGEMSDQRREVSRLLRLEMVQLVKRMRKKAGC